MNNGIGNIHDDLSDVESGWSEHGKMLLLFKNGTTHHKVDQFRLRDESIEKNRKENGTTTLLKKMLIKSMIAYTNATYRKGTGTSERDVVETRSGNKTLNENCTITRDKSGIILDQKMILADSEGTDLLEEA